MIRFEQPTFLKQSVDMHFHTVHSDGSATVDEVLAKSREKGFGIAISDHNQISGVLEAFSKKTEHDFIIPAIEVKSRELIDILFYFAELEDLKRFYESEIKSNIIKFLHTTRTKLTITRVYDISKIYPCMAVVAHPFGYSVRTTPLDLFKKYEKILSRFDVFEAINGGNLRKDNLKALSYLTQNKKCFTGGSDAHSLVNIGNVVTVCDAKTPKEFLDKIIKKENQVIGLETKGSKLGEYRDYAVSMVKKIIR